MDILENYLNEIYENKNKEYLSEDIKSFVSKLKNLNMKNMISSLQTSAKSKDINKIKKIVNSIKMPTISNKKIVDVMKKNLPNFNKSYEISKRVVSNSIPNLSEKIIDSVSIAVAAKSTYKSDDPIKDTKETLLTTIPQMRKYIGSGTSLDGGQIIGAAIIIIFVIAGIVTITAYGLASFIVLLVMGALLLALRNCLY